ncbi:acetyltransferase, putative [Entamoeba invadens IP1]|uniref:Acetyltransferase, putative n=1 Tax=Entamoeba invadens IP1 TaxID=370355 RepID=A0A0A1TX34_ENTIV|nr:acetyltransferase, putative [Entamoeba invadens IP1]ELP85823.1 acetyltransferase, putative [Entamoeba invadens IP1]|eukprot:XP_004185169.1 acetyltransferase, putative [Entamoeba invadens IP1]
MFTVRQAQPLDYNNIVKLRFESFISCHDKDYERMIKSSPVCYVATTDDNKVIGVCLCKQSHNYQFGNIGIIETLCVHRKYRNIGVGTQLIKETENALIENYGCTGVILQVRITNKAARHLYEKTFGFVQQQILEGYYGNEDGLLMYQKFKISQLENSDLTSFRIEQWKEDVAFA